MTTAADDIVGEAAFEAFLAGRPAPEGADDSFHAVAAFAGAVRATATLPGRPNAALAELLATGLLTDQSSPSTRTATSAGKSPRRSRVRRRRFAVFFPALLAKFLSAGAVAQATSGAGIALVAFTGAGVAGVLPDPVQDTFTSVVGSETADETADETAIPEDTTATDPGEIDTPEVVTEVPVEAELTPEEWAARGPSDEQTFGDWVHAAFPDGKADGQIVSYWARLKHVNVHEIEGIEDVEGIEDLDDSGVATPTGEVEAETEGAGENSGGNGNGNGRGNGGGNGNGNGRGHN